MQMQLSLHQKNTIITNFQKLKLSYDYTHNKVSVIPKSYMQSTNELFFLIPKGSKYYVWFTCIEDQKVCVFINSYFPKRNVFVYPVKFNKYLSINTVMYGTLHFLKTKTQHGHKVFSVEDILMYKGYDLRTQSEQYRLSCLLSLLDNDLPSNSDTDTNTKTNIKFSPCQISLSYEELLQNYYDGKYSYAAYSIQTRFAMNPYIFNRKRDSRVLASDSHPSSSSSFSKYETMDVTADIKRDIYHLHKGDVYIGIADVPDFKTSVMMNKLFRFIKENDNLDALEESDDEEEFQDIREDKFLRKDTSYKMECMINHKTKRYIPISVSVI